MTEDVRVTEHSRRVPNARGYTVVSTINNKIGDHGVHLYLGDFKHPVTTQV